MIRAKCFTLNWIQEKHRTIGNFDPGLLEKTIYVFDLLGRLVKNELDFVFKGGTSLLLLLKNFKRLSIDLDIMCERKIESLPSVFNCVIKNSQFFRWEEDSRAGSDIPKKHFKFYFNSVINNREDYVLLDILKETQVYPNTQFKFINLEFFECESSVKVKVPTINGIVGDKLTTFAPNTVGIPYQQDSQINSMQIIKQLFDLGELFPFVSNLQEIAVSYKAFLSAENSYRHKNYSIDDTLNDTIDTCYLISQLDLRGSIENEQTTILRRGIRQIQSHLINHQFQLNETKLAAARTALLSKMLQTNSTPTSLSLHFDSKKLIEIGQENLSGKLAILNRLKPILPEVFYYWFLFSNLDKYKSK
jgi:predicted nucleotidyltransferase component of viral defense system